MSSRVSSSLPHSPRNLEMNIHTEMAELHDELLDSNVVILSHTEHNGNIYDNDDNISVPNQETVRFERLENGKPLQSPPL